VDDATLLRLVRDLAADRRGIRWYLLYEAADEALAEVESRQGANPHEIPTTASDDSDRL